MNIFYFKDVFELICNYLDIKILLQLELLSTWHKEFIRTCPFVNCEMNMNLFSRKDYMYSVVKTHNFKNINAYGLNIMDKDLEIFSHCTHLNLCNTNITNPSYLVGNYKSLRVNAPILHVIATYFLRNVKINTSLLHAKTMTGFTILTLLSEHLTLKQIEKLIQLGCNLNDVNDCGEGILYDAVVHNNIPLLELLLKYKINCDILTYNKDIISISIELGNIDIAKILINHCTISLPFYGNALLVAMKHKQYDIVELLLKKGVNVHYVLRGRNIVSYACEVNNTYYVKLFMSMGVNGYIPADFAKAASVCNKELMTLFYSVVPNTILHHLCIHNHREACDYTIKLGADPLLLNKQGNTLLLSHIHGKYPITIEDIDYYTSLGIQLNHKNKIGRTALEIAIKRKLDINVIHKLMDKSDYNKELLRITLRFNPNMDIIVPLLAKCNATISLKMVYLALTQNLSTEIIYTLLKYVHFNINNNSTKNEQISYRIHCRKILILLIEKEYDIQLIDIFIQHNRKRDLLIALYTAIEKDNKLVAKKLLPHININKSIMLEGIKITPLMHAMKHNHLVNFLIKHGANQQI